jgi:hypothetical protein
MSVCKMGFGCEAKALVKTEDTDVYLIKKVLTVVNVGQTRSR